MGTFKNGNHKLTEEEKKAKQAVRGRRWRKNNPDKVKATRATHYKNNRETEIARSAQWAQDNVWESFESLTRSKCSQYFGSDSKAGLPNDFKDGVEMAVWFNQKVEANRKRNNGQVLCEATGVPLSYEKNSFFQISYDRLNNTDLGHAKDNTFITYEVFNTSRKDKFSKEEMIEGNIQVAIAMMKKDPKIAKRILKGYQTT